jgi:hypothetical protein
MGVRQADSLPYMQMQFAPKAREREASTIQRFEFSFAPYALTLRLGENGFSRWRRKAKT